jgi:type IV pilus assembly protein PilE
MNIPSSGLRCAASSGSSPDRSGLRGFTLIELMITVAIVALLASIAYPAYLDSVRKGRRAEGRSALLNLLQQQERFYTQTGSYMSFTAGAIDTNGTIAIAGVDSDLLPIPFKTKSGDGSPAYLLSAAVCTGFTLNECVLLSAVPQRADPEAGTLTVTTAGAKSCTGTKTSVCW